MYQLLLSYQKTTQGNNAFVRDNVTDDAMNKNLQLQQNKTYKFENDQTRYYPSFANEKLYELSVNHLMEYSDYVPSTNSVPFGCQLL
jgi:hypothetical protein